MGSAKILTIFQKELNSNITKKKEKCNGCHQSFERLRRHLNSAKAKNSCQKHYNMEELKIHWNKQDQNKMKQSREKQRLEDPEKYKKKEASRKKDNREKQRIEDPEKYKQIEASR